MHNIPYDDFLKSKVRLAQSDGFVVDFDEINSALKPHNKLMVKWLVEGGRRACFASFGLHKTVTQLETIRLVLTRTGGRGLIIAPLGVRAEFKKDALNLLKWEQPPKFVRSIDECEEEFWLWVASWALFVSRPSDLTGDINDDIGYDLPPLDIRWHEIPSDHTKAGAEKNGQYKMYAETAIGLAGGAKEKRGSLIARIAKMNELRNEDIVENIEAEAKNRESLKWEAIEAAFGEGKV